MKQLPLLDDNVVPFTSHPRSYEPRDRAWCRSLAVDLVREFSGLERAGLRRDVLAAFISSMTLPATEREVSELTRLLLAGGARAPVDRDRSGTA